MEGLRSYFLDWWNCLDVMVLSMYLASFALRVLIVLKGYFLCHDYDSIADCIYFTQTGEKMITSFKLNSSPWYSKYSMLFVWVTLCRRAPSVASGGPPADCGGAVCSDEHVELHAAGVHPAGTRVSGYSADLHREDD